MAAVVLVAVEASGATPWHLQGWNGRCELKIERRADSTAAWVEFYHGGRCYNDGSDVRVTDENGILLPHAVTTAGPGDRLLITFKIPSTDTAWLYYGNRLPQAGNRLPQASPQAWQPEAGVLMKVYRLGEGRSDTVEEFRDLVRNSTELLGSGYRPKIFDGFSPFSDSDNFLAVYDGWLRIDAANTYSFCTNSDDSSFFYIDGKLVASFPGRHGPSAVHGEQNGSVALDKGVHRLTYFHVEYAGGQAAVAGWKPPGAKYYTLLEDDRFVPISRARIVSNESPQGPALDFQFEYAQNYVCDPFGTRVMIGAACKPMSASAIGARAMRWEFGDGQTSTQFLGAHAYLSQGLKTITLEAVDGSNRTWRVAHQIAVYAIEGHNAENPGRVGARAQEIVRGYALDALTLDELEVLAEFWQARENTAQQAVVLRHLLNRLPDNDERLGKWGARYVELLADAADPETVAQRKRALEALLAKPLATSDEANLRLLYGDHLLYAERAYAKAEAQYEASAELTKNGELHRAALIRLGDAALEQGNLELARERYEAVPLTSQQSRTETVLHNAYGHLVENAIRQRQYDDALATIEEWETALPADKLDGYSFALRVRVAIARRDTRTAKRYATLIIDTLEADAHKPEAYYALITLLIQERSITQARELYDRFREAFPTNYLVEELGATLGSPHGKEPA